MHNADTSALCNLNYQRYFDVEDETFPNYNIEQWYLNSNHFETTRCSHMAEQGLRVPDTISVLANDGYWTSNEVLSASDLQNLSL